MTENSARHAEPAVTPATVSAGADEGSSLRSVESEMRSETAEPEHQQAPDDLVPTATPDGPAGAPDEIARPDPPEAAVDAAPPAMAGEPAEASTAPAEPPVQLDPVGASADTAEPAANTEIPQTNEQRAITVSLALSEPPRLVADEDPLAYEDMLTRTSLAVKPADFIEEVWVREVVDMTWEIERLRRQKTGLLVSCAPDGLAALLSSYFGVENAKNLSSDWAWGRPEAIKYVKKILADAGMSMDAVMGRALALKIDEFERIDHMIMHTQAARNAELREIQRHRAILGERLSQAVKEVEDAEFQVVEPDPNGSAK